MIVVSIMHTQFTNGLHFAVTSSGLNGLLHDTSPGDVVSATASCTRGPGFKTWTQSATLYVYITLTSPLLFIYFTMG
jgi:hypothetical protein